MSPRGSGGAVMDGTKNCWQQGSTMAWRGFMARENELATTNGTRGGIAPLPRRTHNMKMKGGPLNVMEAVGTSKSQHDWRVSSSKIRSVVS